MRRLALAVAATVAFAGAARADVQYYTNAADFLAALGQTANTTTYNNLQVDSQIGQGGTLNGLMYNFSGPSTWQGYPVSGSPVGRIDGVYNAFGAASLSAFRDPVSFASEGETPNLSQFYPGESFTVTPTGSDPLYAIGVYFNANPGVTQPGDYFIQTSVGTAENGDWTTAEATEWGPARTMFFVGLISTTPFSSATIGSVATASPDINTYRNFFNVDNLTYSTVAPAAIPEPATLAVLGGLLGVGGLAYRRRRTTPAV